MLKADVLYILKHKCADRKCTISDLVEQNMSHGGV